MFPSGLRTLLTAAGVFIPLALSNAQACDNDRFPCPVVSEVAPQDTVDIVAEPPRNSSAAEKSSTGLTPIGATEAVRYGAEI